MVSDPRIENLHLVCETGYYEKSSAAAAFLSGTQDRLAADAWHEEIGHNQIQAPLFQPLNDVHRRSAILGFEDVVAEPLEILTDDVPNHGVVLGE